MRLLFMLAIFVVHKTCGQELICNTTESLFTICGTDTEIRSVVKQGTEQNFELSITRDMRIGANALNGLEIKYLFFNGKPRDEDDIDTFPTLTLDEDSLQGLPDLQILKINMVKVRFNGNPLDKVREVTGLYLEGCDLSEVPTELLASLPKLHTLDLTRNNITILRANAFANVSNTLADLDLSRNKMTTIEEGAINGLDSLEILKLSRNRFGTVPTTIRGMKNLKRLDIVSDEALTAIGTGAFQDLPNLIALFLQFNHIRRLEPGCFDNLSELKVLRLEDNYILNIPKGVFNNLGRLEKLNLESNHIETIESGAFDGLQLKVLNFHFNKFKTVPVGVFNNQSIASLSLSDCEIKEIKPRSFDGLQATTLDLSINSLRKIGREDFIGLNADVVKLNRNEIEEIANDAFKDSDIRKINLDGNSLLDRNVTAWGFKGSL
uniref:LRRCT domain-containing protein n=1 Tax=Bracon brevicornis TaxID=1563983 RepID=A0A6V7IMB8_9HYME